MPNGDATQIFDACAGVTSKPTPAPTTARVSDDDVGTAAKNPNNSLVEGGVLAGIAGIAFLAFVVFIAYRKGQETKKETYYLQGHHRGNSGNQPYVEMGNMNGGSNVHSTGPNGQYAAPAVQPPTLRESDSPNSMRTKELADRYNFRKPSDL
jgi:hypothetical protein